MNVVNALFANHAISRNYDKAVVRGFVSNGPQCQTIFLQLLIF